MSANRFASLAYDDDDEVSTLLQVKPEPIVHIPTDTLARSISGR